MSPSIQRRLSWWLSFVILVAGLVAAAAAYSLAYRDATGSQDAQLAQVAAALSRGSFKDVPPARGETGGESIDAFVVVPVGAAGDGADGARASAIALPASIRDGLQTVVQDGRAWRVRVTRDSNGERFGVVQSIEARTEDARDSARLTLVPIALLIPILLVAVHVLLKTLFAPLAQLSGEMDRVTGASLASISHERVPREFVPFVEAVNRLLSRLAQTIAEQRRFIADAAHEMRSPVAALMIQAGNVQHCDLPPEARDRVASLRGGLARMAALQDQLLSFARARVPSTSSPRRIALDAVVRDAIEDLLPMAAAKGVELACVRLDATGILGETRHAVSLVRNALDNGIRYTPAGGVVDVSLRVDGRIACFVVEDTGPGIAPADLPFVFEPFVRVPGSNEAGSGLGLAIVRAAADAMSGSVELSARRDRAPGLRFCYRQAAA